MTTDHADLLLASPLGRSLVLDAVGIDEIGLYQRLDLGLPPGVSQFTASPQGRRPRRLRTSHLRLHWPGAPRRRSARAERDRLELIAGVRPEAVRDVIAAAVADGGWRACLQDSPVQWLDRLQRHTFHFGFSPGHEALWQLSEHACYLLQPVARAITAAPGTSAWWQPLGRSDQRLIQWWADAPRTGADLERAVREGAARERAENEEGLARAQAEPRRPGVRYGATWWSAPDWAEANWTTSPAGDWPSIELAQFIDTLIPASEADATIWSVQVADDARVLEITGPADWQDLAERLGRDVTGTHDGEWRDWGQASGPWRLPDWELVMDDYDGVHVTIGGYVASCGLALPVTGGYTMLAGWVPGATLWLRDVATARRRLGRWTGPLGGLDPSDLAAHWHPGNP